MPGTAPEPPPLGSGPGGRGGGYDPLANPPRPGRPSGAPNGPGGHYQQLYQPRDTSSSRQPLMNVQVSFAAANNGKGAAQFVVYEGEDYENVLDQFAKKHNLEENQRKFLYDEVQKTLEGRSPSVAMSPQQSSHQHQDPLSPVFQFRENISPRGSHPEDHGVQEWINKAASFVPEQTVTCDPAPLPFSTSHPRSLCQAAGTSPPSSPAPSPRDPMTLAHSPLPLHSPPPITLPHSPSTHALDQPLASPRSEKKEEGEPAEPVRVRVFPSGLAEKMGISHFTKEPPLGFPRPNQENIVMFADIPMGGPWADHPGGRAILLDPPRIPINFEAPMRTHSPKKVEASLHEVSHTSPHPTPRPLPQPRRSSLASGGLASRSPIDKHSERDKEVRQLMETWDRRPSPLIPEEDPRQPRVSPVPNLFVPTARGMVRANSPERAPEEEYQKALERRMERERERLRQRERDWNEQERERDREREREKLEWEREKEKIRHEQQLREEARRREFEVERIERERVVRELQKEKVEKERLLREMKEREIKNKLRADQEWECARKERERLEIQVLDKMRMERYREKMEWEREKANLKYEQQLKDEAKRRELERERMERERAEHELQKERTAAALALKREKTNLTLSREKEALALGKAKEREILSALRVGGSPPHRPESSHPIPQGRGTPHSPLTSRAYSPPPTQHHPAPHPHPPCPPPPTHPGSPSLTEAALSPGKWRPPPRSPTSPGSLRPPGSLRSESTKKLNELAAAVEALQLLKQKRGVEERAVGTASPDPVPRGRPDPNSSVSQRDFEVLTRAAAILSSPLASPPRAACRASSPSQAPTSLIPPPAATRPQRSSSVNNSSQPPSHPRSQSLDSRTRSSAHPVPQKEHPLSPTRENLEEQVRRITEMRIPQKLQEEAQKRMRGEIPDHFSPQAEVSQPSLAVSTGQAKVESPVAVAQAPKQTQADQPKPTQPPPNTSSVNEHRATTSGSAPRATATATWQAASPRTERGVQKRDVRDRDGAPTQSVDSAERICNVFERAEELMRTRALSVSESYLRALEAHRKSCGLPPPTEKDVLSPTAQAVSPVHRKGSPPRQRPAPPAAPRQPSPTRSPEITLGSGSPVYENELALMRMTQSDFHSPPYPPSPRRVDLPIDSHSPLAGLRSLVPSIAPPPPLPPLIAPTIPPPAGHNGLPLPIHPEASPMQDTFVPHQPSSPSRVIHRTDPGWGSGSPTAMPPSEIAHPPEHFTRPFPQHPSRTQDLHTGRSHSTHAGRSGGNSPPMVMVQRPMTPPSTSVQSYTSTTTYRPPLRGNGGTVSPSRPPHSSQTVIHTGVRAKEQAESIRAMAPTPQPLPPIGAHEAPRDAPAHNHNNIPNPSSVNVTMAQEPRKSHAHRIAVIQPSAQDAVSTHHTASPTNFSLGQQRQQRGVYFNSSGVTGYFSPSTSTTA